MGNCSFKGIADGFPNSIRVLTDSGTILELKSPKLAREVLENYPGYGIFPRGHGSSPLAAHERLVSGQFYYLLPLEKQQKQQVQVAEKLDVKWVEQMEPPKMSSADFVDSLAKVNTEALIEKMRMAASSASLTPRRTRNSWVVGWRKPALFNVFKVPTETGK
ncbi:hypothetical protein Patl1_17499 [Pistacia atlantica]|uniref:Uncharacterized protein n=1 Tax=Pistacia atlantica TaxID=434234 RepID=A0ACC1C0I0_9ROSI|nr:hypothetical protein Patl1_17499 [Pistacia atlantica]